MPSQIFLLNEHKLRKGDIILLKFDNEKSEFIRRISNSEFSHAMLYVGGYSLIDADGPGVHAHNLQRLLIPKEDDALVLRPTNATADQLWKVEQFVRAKVGTEYSMEEARKVVRNGEFVPEDNRQFCTRLVAKAYEFAGFQIVERPDYCSPKDIETSNELSIVEGVTRFANEKEIDYANETDTPLQKQEEVTSKVLEDVRSLTGEDIQTFEQLDEYLIKHPEHDNEVSRIVTDTGYLNLWEIDIEKNPWHYDIKEFVNHYPEIQHVHTAKWLVNICKELYFRFETMRQYYEEQSSSNNISYFSKMLELYKKLLELNNKRMEVAIDVLIEAGLDKEEIMGAAQN